jgi:hypothetical protein
MIIAPYQAAHFDEIVFQEHQAFLQNTAAGSDFAKQLESHDSFTGLVDGRVIVVAGISPVWPGRAIAWAYFARDAGEHFIPIVKSMQRFLKALNGWRVEAHVDANFSPAIRLVELLGFERETPKPMIKFTSDGRSMYQYSRYCNG